MPTYTGDDKDNIHYGPEGTQYGRGGNDNLQGSVLNTPYNMYGGDGNDTLSGGDAGDLLDGGNGLDALFGESGADQLFGRGGSDRLVGWYGHDTISSGSGHDVIGYGADARDAANSDHITDFNAKADRFDFNLPDFSEVGALGKLAKGMFHAGSAADDADDRFIYDQGNGCLYYDADGTGGQGQVLIAVLDNKPHLTHHDIVMMET